MNANFLIDLEVAGESVRMKDGAFMPRLKKKTLTIGQKYEKLASRLIGRSNIRSLGGKHASWSGLGLLNGSWKDKVPFKVS